MAEFTEQSGFTSIAEFSSYARALYDDYQTLREADQQRAIGRHSTYDLAIPDPMLDSGRATPVFAHTVDEKVQRLKSLVTDAKGLSWNVAQIGGSKRLTDWRRDIEDGLTAVWRETLRAAERDPEEQVTEDLAVYSRAFLRVLPAPRAYEGGPSDPDLDDDEYVIDVVVGGGEADLKQRSRDLEEQVQDYRLAHCPIEVEWVPAESVITESNGRGLTDVWEFRRMSVRRVLNDWRDDDDEPRAQALAAATRGQKLTPKDLCTVVIHADRRSYQVAVLGWVLDQAEGDATDARDHAYDELVFAGEHGMGVVPYAPFIGSTTNAADPALQYRSWVDPILSLAKQKDEALTQHGSSLRTAAWPFTKLKREPGTARAQFSGGGGDQQPNIQFSETAPTVLGPGEDIEPLRLIDPAALSLQAQFIDRLDVEINKLTLGPASYGARSENGYLFAQQQAANETTLEPVERALSNGFRRTGELVLAAARALLTGGCWQAPALSSIPLRHQQPDGQRTLAWTRELVTAQWDISCTVKARPPGGEMAATQTAKEMMAAGLSDRHTEMLKLGNKDPEQTDLNNAVDAVLHSPDFLKFVNDLTIGRMAGALDNTPATKLAGDLALPAASAGLWTSPAIQARLGGQGGLPGGPPRQTPRPNGPTDAGAQNLNGVGGQGGGVLGQAQALPGGMARQDATLALQGA